MAIAHRQTPTKGCLTHGNMNVRTRRTFYVPPQIPQRSWKSAPSSPEKNVKPLVNPQSPASRPDPSPAHATAVANQRFELFPHLWPTQAHPEQPITSTPKELFQSSTKQQKEFFAEMHPATSAQQKSELFPEKLSPSPNNTRQTAHLPRPVYSTAAPVPKNGSPARQQIIKSTQPPRPQFALGYLAKSLKLAALPVKAKTPLITSFEDLDIENGSSKILSPATREGPGKTETLMSRSVTPTSGDVEMEDEIPKLLLVKPMSHIEQMIQKKNVQLVPSSPTPICKDIEMGSPSLKESLRIPVPHIMRMIYKENYPPLPGAITSVEPNLEATRKKTDTQKQFASAPPSPVSPTLTTLPRSMEKKMRPRIQRPETTDMVARRMIGNALGINIAKRKDERSLEIAQELRDRRAGKRKGPELTKGQEVEATAAGSAW